MHKRQSEELEKRLKELFLAKILKTYSAMADEARKETASYEEFLLSLLRQECESRRQKRIARYLKESRLPLEKTLDAFEMKRLPGKALHQVKALLDGEFIDRHENLLVFGTPGSGKTHLVSGIGQELIKKDKRIYFTSCAILLQDLLRAKKELKLAKLLKKLGGFDGVIIDDIGYVQEAKEEMEVFFTFLAERYERGSVMITSNLPFSKWDNIFKDQMMTAAAIDRIVHHSVILELNITSYRIDCAKRDVARLEPKEKEHR
jgi:DNA replication protein DnaC